MRLDNNTNCLLQAYQQTEPRVYAEENNINKEKIAQCPYKNQSENLKTDSCKNDDSSLIITTFCKVSNPDELPSDIAHLLPAARESLPADYNLPDLPPWLDLEKLKKGQAFGLKYLYGLNYAESLSLLFLFSAPDGLKPLIYTEKSHTPRLAQKRYLSTVLRVKSWYETEIWKSTSEGYKNLKSVRGLHLSVSNRLNKISVDMVNQKSNLEEKLESSDTGMLCPLLSTLKKDFKNSGPTCPMKTPKSERIYLNQMEMAFTQFGFYGLILVYPEKFAAKTATDEEMACFVHLWRYIGYMLGIKDEYNLCNGSLEEIRRRSSHLVEYFLRPMMLNVTKDWEHMARSALQGIEKFTKLIINFEAAMLYFCWVLDIQTPNLMQYVGWKEQLLFNLTKLVMTEGHKVPGLGRLFNYTIRKNVEKAAIKSN